MKKWEYMVLEVQAAQTGYTEGRLAGFGAGGWEVVGVCAIGSVQFIYMKRERRTSDG